MTARARLHRERSEAAMRARETTMARRAAGVLAAISLALSAGEARGDLLPPPDTSGCAERDAGAACILENGAPGRCRADIDARRNRRFTRCEPIPECDVVPVGGVCHGFGGRPAHCREIVDDRTHRPFRMCVADESSYAALNDAATTSPDPAPSTPDAASVAIEPAHTTANSPASTSQPVSAAARSSRCSVGPIGAANGLAGLVSALALLGVSSARRRRR